MPTIQHKRSTTPGSSPQANNLAAGELAINTADMLVYAKDSNGSVVVVGRQSPMSLAGNNLMVGGSSINAASFGALISVPDPTVHAVGSQAAAATPKSYVDTQVATRAASSHTHEASAINSGTLGIARIPTGATSSTVCIGNDSRLSDARTPTSHKSTHATGGADALTPADIGAAAASHTHALSTLTGVSLTSPTSGQVLKYDGTNWVNGTDSTAGGVSDGDKGDVIVSSGGTVWSVDSSTVAKLTGDQTFSGQKSFTSVATFEAAVELRATPFVGSSTGAAGIPMRFLSASNATNGGTIVFGSDLSGNAQATPKGSIKNLGTPSEANDAANKGYVDGEVATKANTSHTHGNITSAGFLGTTANIPLITGTGGIIQAGSFGTTANSFCQGNDSRLSDARTPTSHTHGNITNAGAIGSTSGLPIITTTSGVLTTGSFGTTAGTFCQGNDSRLSDARTPTSHTHGNITNAGAIGTTSGVPIITGASGVLQAGSFGTTAGTFCQGDDSRLSNARTPTSHTHAAADVDSGTFDIARIPTGSSSTTVCIGNDARLSDSRTPTSHTHGNITNAGAIGTTANLPVITTTSGVLTTGSFGTAVNTFCQGNDARLSDARTPTSHTHGNITNAGAIGSASGVPIITGTGGVLQAGSFGTTSGSFCQGNDARLSDARTPTSHVHGNITNAGAIGTTSGVPIITGASGVLQAGQFGTSAGQFAQGNHTHSLSNLSDVIFTSLSSGQVLKYDGTKWVNGTDSTGGGGSVTAEDDQIILAMRVFA